MDDSTPKQLAIRTAADSIGSHQPVKADIGWTCRNRLCVEKGVLFLNLDGIYVHQAIVAVNDVLRSKRFSREGELEELNVPEAEFRNDPEYARLTELLDMRPAGRSYAERQDEQEHQTAGTPA